MSFKLTDFITVTNTGITTFESDGVFIDRTGADAYLFFRNSGTNRGSIYGGDPSGNAGLRFYIANNSDPSIVLTSVGNVGIGTTSPTNLSSQTSLTIQGASVSRLDLLGASGAGGGVVFGTATAFTVQGNYGVPLVLDAGTTADMNFNIGGSTKLTISSGGNATFSGDIIRKGNVGNISFEGGSVTNINAQIQYDQVNDTTGQLFFKTANSGTLATRLTISSGGNADFSEYVRVKGDTAAFTTGVGVEMSYNSTSNRGQIGVYDRGNSAYKQVYFYGSDYVFDVGGTPKLTISSAGLTQINSTSTTALELITNQSASSLRLKNTGSIVADWIMQSGGITAGDLAFYNLDTSAYRLTISSGGNATLNGYLQLGTSASQTILGDFGETNTYLINYNSGGTLKFLVGGGTTSDEKLTITSGGVATFTNGTSYELLQLKTSRTDANYGIELYHSDSTLYGYLGGTGSSVLTGASTGDLVIRGQGDVVFASGGNNRRLTITSGGNVGIAKSPSTYRLDLETTSGGNGLKITRGTAAFQVFQAANGASYVGTGNADTLHLITDGSSKMSITSGGVVNINTTGSGTNKLQVGGGMTVWYDSNFVRSASVIYDGLYINGHNGYLWQGTAHDWVIGTNGTERMRVTSGGTVQVYGTASANALSIDHSSSNDVLISIPFQSVNQDFIIRNSSAGVNLDYAATSWVSASDENIKENITSLDNVLDKIKNIRCVNYNLKDEEIYKKRLGFIAQDFQENFEEVTSINNDDVLGLRYTETIPILMKAIQEQQTQIEELKSEIQLLKNN